MCHPKIFTYLTKTSLSKVSKTLRVFIFKNFLETAHESASLFLHISICTFTIFSWRHNWLTRRRAAFEFRTRSTLLASMAVPAAPNSKSTQLGNHTTIGSRPVLCKYLFLVRKMISVTSNWKAGMTVAPHPALPPHSLPRTQL